MKSIKCAILGAVLACSGLAHADTQLTVSNISVDNLNSLTYGAEIVIITSSGLSGSCTGNQANMQTFANPALAPSTFTNTPYSYEAFKRDMDMLTAALVNGKTVNLYLNKDSGGYCTVNNVQLNR